MSGFPCPVSLIRALDANGDPVDGAKLYVFDADTTDAASVYTDFELTSAAANPLSSDSAGKFAPLYMAVGDYKLRITDADDNTLFEFNDFKVLDYDPSTNLQLVPTSVTSNLSVDADDRGKILQVDASGAPGSEVTITADFDDLGAGFAFGVINIGASGTVVIQGSGAETINGASSLTLSVQNSGVGVLSLGSAGARVIWNTGGIFTGDLNFTGDVDIDGDLNVDGVAVFDQAITEGSQTLTDQANIAWDMSAAPNAVVTLGGNRTLDAPTGEVAGMRGILRIVQDGTGSRTLTWANAYKFPNGNDEKPGSAASSTTVYLYYVRGSDDIIVKKLWMSGRNSIGFWREFTAAFAVGSGSGSKLIDTAHGLGRYPAAVQTYLECTTTDLGYAVGDRILCDGGIGDGGGSARMLMTIVSTTNVAILAGSVVPSITRKDTNASGTITAANWTAVSRIYE